MSILRRNVRNFGFILRQLSKKQKTYPTNFRRLIHISGTNFSDTWSENERSESENAERDQKSADEEELIKSKILDFALEHVGQHGWSRLAIAAGAEAGGYLSVASGLFPREGDDLVFHHIRKSNKSLDKWMEEEVNRFKAEGSKLPVGLFVKSAVKHRLLLNQHFVSSGRWGEALAILAKPQNIASSVCLLQEVCDDIWYRAGDLSADLNWYSKRMLLAGIISSTEVFMVQDTSPDFQETWKFLDRRFEDIANIPNLGNLPTLPQDLTGLVSGLFVTAKNIAGVQK